MFNLQVAWDRPIKLSSQLSEHILRVRILPLENQTTTQQEPQTLPLQLAIALDTSASMQGEKWEKAKAACQSLVAQLRPCDRLSIAGFADWVTPLAKNLPSVELGNLPTILNTLVAEGVTRTDLALNWIHSTLSSETVQTKVGILITDGYPTSQQGDVLENFESLILQAENMAAQGMMLCVVGLGDAADFNSGLLVSLSDRGKGTFIYADQPILLTPQLQEQLQVVQKIAVTNASLKLNLLEGVKLKNICQFRPEYLPLTVNDSQMISLQNLRADVPTDILLAFDFPAFNLNEFGNYIVAEVQLEALEFAPITAQVPLQFTNSYREAQQFNQEVDRDRLCWDINRYSTELTLVNDPMQTGKLLSQIQAAALKSGQINIAAQVTQQLDLLQKTGNLDVHQTTSLLRSSRRIMSG